MSKKSVRSDFRKSVMQRDKYRCKMCGKCGRDRQGGEDWKKYNKEAVIDLDSHHITNRSQMPNGGYVPENGITLCDDCHPKAEKFHISGGKDWDEFFHPNDLYVKIGSSLEQAIKASEKLEED